jgi:hypothetical protein
MTDLRQAAQTVLDLVTDHGVQGMDRALTALRKALEQPAQHPVAWMWKHKTTEKCGVYFEDPADIYDSPSAYYDWTPLYTTPPAAQPEQVDCPRCGHVCSQRPWQGLTDDDLEFWTEELGQGELGRGVIRAVADHLKERNT